MLQNAHLKFFLFCFMFYSINDRSRQKTFFINNILENLETERNKKRSVKAQSENFLKQQELYSSKELYLNFSKTVRMLISLIHYICTRIRKKLVSFNVSFKANSVVCLGVLHVFSVKVIYCQLYFEMIILQQNHHLCCENK